MSRRFPVYVVALLLISLSSGCGKNVSVTGKVTFEDGTPLTEGTVVFQDAKLIARGHIQEDGSYALISGDVKGIPRGFYQISIQGFGNPKVEAVPGTGSEFSAPVMRMVFTPSPIDEKFYTPETSGLTCEVKRRMVHNIRVEPPAK